MGTAEASAKRLSLALKVVLFLSKIDAKNDLQQINGGFF